MFEIYCDMDGVLANFDKRFYGLTGIAPDKYIEHYGDKKFWNVITADVFFWKEEEPMEDAHVLWSYLKQYTPTILTTPGGNIEMCKNQKMSWVNEHLGSDIKIVFSFNKYKYATPEAILIDDMEKNIIPWREAGGIGILHKDAKSTIKKLNKLLKEHHAAETIIRKAMFLDLDKHTVKTILEGARKNNAITYDAFEKFMQLQLNSTDVSVEDIIDAVDIEDEKMAEFVYMIIDSKKDKKVDVHDDTVTQSPNIAINVVTYGN